MNRAHALRPTLKTIAAAVGLSVAAVSLALRQHRSIPAATRRRVEQTAARLGYSRDPEIAKLMAHLRRGQLRRRSGALGLLTMYPEASPWRTNPHLERVFRVARARAAQLGYDLEECWLNEAGMTAARLRDVLIARGIEGILLLGAPRWIEDLDFDFSRFACAATGYSIRNQIHRACQHHHQEMFIALRRLQALGYRRPGLFLSEDADFRTLHHWSAAFLAGQHALAFAPPLPLLITRTVSRDVLLSWIRKHRPDVLISQSPTVPTVADWLQGSGLAVPAACGIADLDLDPGTDGGGSGIRQNYEQVAAAAVDLVVEQILANERGLPSHPKVVLVAGEWVDGTTTRAQT